MPAIERQSSSVKAMGHLARRLYFAPVPAPPARPARTPRPHAPPAPLTAALGGDYARTRVGDSETGGRREPLRTGAPYVDARHDSAGRRAPDREAHRLERGRAPADRF